MRWFDYLYYRTYKWYEPRDAHPWIYGRSLTTLIQTVLVLDTFLLLREIFTIRPLSSLLLKAAILITFVFLFVVNHIRYSFTQNIEKLDDCFGKEGLEEKKKNGYLLVVSLLVLILIPVVIGILKHNLNII